VTTRKMTSPASATLNYTLFRDSARTVNWGNTVGTDTLVSQANGTAVQYGVFGRMAAGQSGQSGPVQRYDHCHRHLLTIGLRWVRLSGRLSDK
jgi:hypothetical protein